MLIDNVFIKHLKGIVQTAYGGVTDGEEPTRDWQTAIDIYNAEHHITDGMSEGRVAQQRSDFLQYVQGKKFNKDGDRI